MAGILLLTTTLFLLPTIFLTKSTQAHPDHSLPLVTKTDYGPCVYFKQIPANPLPNPKGIPAYDGLFTRFFAGQGPDNNTFTPGFKITDFTATFIFAPELNAPPKPIGLAAWALGLTISEADNGEVLIPLDIVVQGSVPVADYERVNVSLPKNVREDFSNLSYGVYKWEKDGVEDESLCTQRLDQFKNESVGEKIKGDCPPRDYTSGRYKLPSTTTVNYKATNGTGVSYLLILSGFDIPQVRIAARVCFKDNGSRGGKMKG